MEALNRILKSVVVMAAVMGIGLTSWISYRHLIPKNVEEYMKWKHGKVPIDHSREREYWRENRVDLIREMWVFAGENGKVDSEILPDVLGEKCRRVLEISRWSPEYKDSIENANKFCTKPE